MYTCKSCSTCVTVVTVRAPRIKAIVITGRNQEKLDKAVTELEIAA